MRKLYQPLVVTVINTKKECITNVERLSIRYGEAPISEKKIFYSVEQFMNEIPMSKSKIYWDIWFLKKNKHKKINTYTKGNLRTIKVSEITSIEYEIQYEYYDWLKSLSIKELSIRLSSNEFLQYLYDKEKEFKMSDIIDILE